ncbi:MAG: aminotransferase class V-fold PLP-dependent enzyme [Candidatus Magasanikbacteria bacterium]|nr:aminotransferase class V-fold PLP-dependent enzyme [Candidatus Magasanikbacteria bacterium]
MNTTNVNPDNLNYNSYTGEKYDMDIFRVIPYYQELNDIISEFVNTKFEKGRQYHILDLGAGTGLTSKLLRDLLPQTKLDIVDFSAPMLESARMRLSENQVNYICTDYSEMEFEPNKYDIIVSVIGLHHQNHKGKKKVLQKIYHSLKPGGWFILGDLVTHADKTESSLNDAKHFHHMVEHATDEKTLAEWAYHHTYLNDLAPKEDLTQWIQDLGFESKILLQKINTLLLIARKPTEIHTENYADLFSSGIQNFPIQTNKLGETSYINFDNAATTPPFLVVEQAVKEFMNQYGSVHRGAGIKSQLSTDWYEESRKIIKEFVHAPQDAYVIFSNNTTGGINMLSHFFSFLPGKIAVSSIEHSSSWLPWIKAEGIKQLGIHRFEHEKNNNTSQDIQTHGKKYVLLYDVDKNLEFDLLDIEHILSEHKIKALVVTASSNVTGYCPDLRSIGNLCKKYNTYFIVDACQYIQHKKINMSELGIDFLVASGHKFYAPYGSGFVIGPKDFFNNFLPYQIGGGNIEYIDESGTFYYGKTNLLHDPGTPNAVGAIAMSTALQKLTELGLKNIHTHEYKITKKIFDYLKTNPQVTVYTKEEHLNSIITFNIKDLSANETAKILNDDYGIGVRAGSFCVYQVIRKLTGTKEGVVRVSVSLCNTVEHADRFIQAIQEITKD